MNLSSLKLWECKLKEKMQYYFTNPYYFGKSEKALLLGTWGEGHPHITGGGVKTSQRYLVRAKWQRL